MPTSTQEADFQAIKAALARMQKLIEEASEAADYGYSFQQLLMHDDEDALILNRAITAYSNLTHAAEPPAPRRRWLGSR